MPTSFSTFISKKLEVSCPSIFKDDHKDGIRHYQDGGIVSTAFNIMPDQDVMEVLHNIRYEVDVKKKEVRAYFSRKYFSGMANSPDHLILTTLQVHSQKMMQLFMFEYFGESYSPDKKEIVKIWSLDMKTLTTFKIDKADDVMQVLKIKKFKKRSKFYVLLNLLKMNPCPGTFSRIYKELMTRKKDRLTFGLNGPKDESKGHDLWVIDAHSYVDDGACCRVGGRGIVKVPRHLKVKK